jgi:phytoene dehydrogenase-like protein
VLAEASGVRGVLLDTGEEVRADVVVSSVDPRTTVVDWLGPHPPAGAERMVARWTARTTPDGYESKLDAVVTTLPVFPQVDRLQELVGPFDQHAATVTIAPGLPAVERAHAALARGEVAARPMALVNTPSALDPTMRVGADHVLSLEVLWTPYALPGGWATSAEPQRWLDLLSAQVRQGFAAGVRRWRVVTPEDYERDLGMPRGWAPSFSGGPLAALVGRDRELTRYATPVRGLYLTGAGTFPGAGVWGASGRNAAAVVRADLERR